MSSEKICPVLSTSMNKNPLTAIKCLNESCALWNEKKQTCAIAAIADGVNKR